MARSFVLMSLIVVVYTVVGQAATQTIQTPFGEKIVHSRLAPVLMHRAVPPFAGKHVYQGRRR